ncbi:hypothetical protein [Clostridium aminobutyricum]|uniref:Uncharacterized protein n=1 Tax=Clostridium aminobutyricum TaxID=33953 RepID=A0A939D775_CLOAM|nr:hypothetical protein [Clostridium aminobutyricum]MBN7772340.1 hypothetical protein [Clostridium aminobutyricum]
MKIRLKQLSLQDDNERYRRPSKQLPLPNEFTFQNFAIDDTEPSLITDVFNDSEDVIKAFFGILKNASNMEDYLGGCGSIGDTMNPYAYAYELYTQDARQEMSLESFKDSFQGIGHINLLKLYPVYIPPGTPENIRYYMFEIEIITGPTEKDQMAYDRGGSYFVYYYGLIAVEYDQNEGWKIRSIYYLPEDFLCAPDHGWSYAAEYLVPIVYEEWYQLIDQIDNMVQNGNLVSVYASNEDKSRRYKFDFVRLTNGYDILLHENIWNKGRWEEINIMRDEGQRLKLSPLNPNFMTA